MSQGEEGSYQQNSFPVPLAVPDPTLPKKVWRGIADRLGQVRRGRMWNYCQMKQLSVPAALSLVLGVGGTWSLYANRGDKMRKIRPSACRVITLFP